MSANLENSAVATGTEKDSFHSNPKERQCQRMLKVKEKLLSCVRLFATAWTVAYQAPPSMRFSRHEYWSGLPFPSPGDLPDPGIEPVSLTFQADTLTSEPPGKQRLKLLPPVRETWLRSLGWEDPLEKEMATHSSTLAWRISWREEPGRLQSTGSQRVGHD